MGLHRGEWRFASISDLTQIIKAVVFGTACIVLVAFVYTRLELVPRSIFVFYAFGLLVGMAGSRLVYRLIKDKHFSKNTGKKTIIIGAGAAGEQLVRDLNCFFR